MQYCDSTNETNSQGNLLLIEFDETWHHDTLTHEQPSAANDIVLDWYASELRGQLACCFIQTWFCCGGRHESWTRLMMCMHCKMSHAWWSIHFIFLVNNNKHLIKTLARKLKNRRNPNRRTYQTKNRSERFVTVKKHIPQNMSNKNWFRDVDEPCKLSNFVLSKLNDVNSKFWFCCNLGFV